jgi:hypothetical protein
LFMWTCVLRVVNLINYIFSTHLQLSNEKNYPFGKKQGPISLAFCWQLWSWHTVCNCDQSGLIKTDPRTSWMNELLLHADCLCTRCGKGKCCVSNHK